MDLLQKEELDRLSFYAVVVCSETAILSEEKLSTFSAYVRSGGTLVLTDATGKLGADGTPHDARELSEAWGLPGFHAAADGGKPAIYRVGSGRLVTVAGDWAASWLERCLNADRWQADEVRVPFLPLGEDGWLACHEVASFLTGLLPGGPDLRIQVLPRDVIATVYETADSQAIVIHLLNAMRTASIAASISAESGSAGRSDPIPTRWLADAPDAAVTVRIPDRSPFGHSNTPVAYAGASRPAR